MYQPINEGQVLYSPEGGLSTIENLPSEPTLWD